MVSFLQSPEWQGIQERMGRQTHRIGGVLVIRHDLPFGLHYLYAPRPGALAPEFLHEIVKLAQGTGAIFLKVDPTEPLDIRNLKLEIRLSHSLQPRETILIDCTKPEAELLEAMHGKTRYNIRLAERHEVSVRLIPAGESALALDQFLPLLIDTARREGFSPHPKTHYQILLELRSEALWSELWVAEWHGALLAAALVNWYRPSNTATYLHGASSRNHREKMAPHLLHWRIIQIALKRNFQTYDFGGIDEVLWPGLTRFKRGFGGSTLTSQPSYDIVFRPWLYRAYRLQHTLRH